MNKEDNLKQQVKIRNDINGLKAIAIISIVFYHFFDLLKSGSFTSFALFDGGFLGVDVFFVVSGFLITASIFKDLERDNFSILNFYKKRFLRIIPPLLVLSVFCYFVGYFILFPDVFYELGKEIANVLIADGNYRFARSGGYFSLQSSDKILLHSWYLCITLQFYIIYPILIISIIKIFGISKLRPTISFLFLLSLVISIIFSRNGNGYLLTHTRIFEIFFGAFIFCYRSVIYSYIQRLKISPLCLEILGILLIVVSIFSVRLSNGEWYIYKSIFTIIGTGLVLVACNNQSILDNNLFNIVGKSSYSLYLWHWPLIIFMMRINFDLDFSHCLCLFVIIFSFSFISYKLIEKKKINNYITLSLYVLCLLSYFYVKNTDGKNYLSDYMVKEASRVVNDEIVLPREYRPSIAFTFDGRAVYHDGLQSKQPHIFFIGDSHADQYFYYFKNIQKEPTYFFAWHANIAYGKNLTSIKKHILVTHEDRALYNKIYINMLNNLKPKDKVILSNRWDVHYNFYVLDKGLEDSADNYKLFLSKLLEDFDEQILKHPELHFYIVGQGIITSDSIVRCLKVDLSKSFLNKFISKDKCRKTKNVLGYKYELTNDTLKKYALSRKNVTFIDRNVPLLLPNGEYRTYDDKGLPLYYDNNHLTSAGGILVGSYLMENILGHN